MYFQINRYTLLFSSKKNEIVYPFLWINNLTFFYKKNDKVEFIDPLIFVRFHLKKKKKQT